MRFLFKTALYKKADSDKISRAYQSPTIKQELIKKSPQDKYITFFDKCKEKFIKKRGKINVRKRKETNKQKNVNIVVNISTLYEYGNHCVCTDKN